MPCCAVLCYHLGMYAELCCAVQDKGGNASDCVAGGSFTQLRGAASAHITCPATSHLFFSGDTQTTTGK